MVGPEHKEFFNGIIGSVGAFIALITAPIAGALSDRSTNPYGKRRPYILVGVIFNIIFLLLMPSFGKGSSLWLFILCYTGVQFGCNWWGGPYAGLIPDLVPESQRGRASGFMMLMTALGVTTGALAAGFLIAFRGGLLIYLLIALTLIITLAITLIGVREQRSTKFTERFNLRQFARSFMLRPSMYREFYIVLVTRAFIMRGIYSVFIFFQYFLRDVVQVSDPIEKSSLLIGVITVAGIPSSIIAGELSDRYGRKRLVYISGSIMIIATAILIFINFNPSWYLTLLVGLLFGIGNGAYHSVDWALAIDVLPSRDTAAKDMGIWHIAIVLPQVLAPALTGLIIELLKSTSLQLGYTTVFITTVIWFISGTILIRRIQTIK